MTRLLVITTLLAAPLASAQEEEPPPAEDTRPHVVVVSVGGDAPEVIAREAREAVAIALDDDGMRVLSEGDVVLRMNPARLRACTAIACAYEIGRELGVATVAAVAVWMNGDVPGSIAVSIVVAETRAHTAREDVGEAGITGAARTAVRGAQDARARALMVEGSIDPETAVEEAEERAELPPPPPSGDRPIEQYVLPAIMGGLGLVIAGVSVYALIGEQCAQFGPSGVCLRGDRPNIGLGAIMAVFGGLCVAGAIVWLILGGEPQGGGNIDVVIGPDGGGASWRGTF